MKRKVTQIESHELFLSNSFFYSNGFDITLYVKNLCNYPYLESSYITLTCFSRLFRLSRLFLVRFHFLVQSVFLVMLTVCHVVPCAARCIFCATLWALAATTPVCFFSLVAFWVGFRLNGRDFKIRLEKGKCTPESSADDAS